MKKLLNPIQNDKIAEKIALKFSPSLRKKLMKQMSWN